MDELTQICTTLLDNADLCISLDGKRGIICLEFFTNSEGALVEITFECGQFHLFKVTKDPEDSDVMFVGETRVTQITDDKQIEYWLGSEGWTWGERQRPNELYRVEVFGGVEISIICEKFIWKKRIL